VSKLPDIPAAEESSEWVRQELRPILDYEISRLPQKYRQVFVLCYLEGQTNEQAANQLGCPLGTVLSRLARARERLRGRLTRRGLAVSAGALAAVLAGEAAAVVVPPLLTQTAVPAAVLFAGGGVLASNVSALSKGFLRSRFRARALRVAAGFVSFAFAALVVLLLSRRLQPEPTPVVITKPAPPPGGDQLEVQGVWRVVRMEAEAGALHDPGLDMIFDGERCTLGAAEAPYELESSRSPHEITMFPKQGAPGRGSTNWKAITCDYASTRAACSGPPVFRTKQKAHSFCTS
jgi:hypothetical protein